jgi:hypothetical protein
MAERQPGYGVLNEIAEAAEGLADYVEQLHDLQGRLADISPIVSIRRALLGIGERVSGWDARVTDSLETIRRIAAEIAEAHNVDQRRSWYTTNRELPIDRAGELWGAAKAIRSALTERHKIPEIAVMRLKQWQMMPTTNKPVARENADAADKQGAH